jgi:hypothetical protein
MVARLRANPPRSLSSTDNERQQQDHRAAVNSALRQLHQIRVEGDFPGMSAGLIEQWKKDKLLPDLMIAAKPGESATAREFLRAGFDFELLGQISSARQYYGKALQLSPLMSEARARLVILALPESVENALALMNLMPEDKMAPLVKKLSTMARVDTRAGSQMVNANAADHLLTQWLRHLNETHTPLPAYCGIHLQTLMSDNDGHHASLCRAALTFRELADLALGSIAEDCLRRKIPLTEAAAFAKDLIKAKAKWAREPPPFFSGSMQPQSIAWPAEGVFEHPGTVLILIWDAWQRGAPQEVESVILPLLRSARSINAEAVRTGAALFFCPPERFIEAAKLFIGSDDAQQTLTNNGAHDKFFRGGTLDFVTLVWRLRKLQVSLADLFLSEVVTSATDGSSLDALASYLGIDEKLSSQQTRKFIQDLRDRLVDSDPVRRRVLIAGTRERTRNGSPTGTWEKHVPTPPGTARYVSWLRKLLAEPRTCRIALELAMEDGLTKDSSGRANDLNGVFWEVEKRSPEHLVALLDAYSMLAPAQDFRTWAMEPSPYGSLFATAAKRLMGNRASEKAALAMVQSRNPETFGTGLLFAWAAAEDARDEKKAKDILLRFVAVHGAEFKLIPAENWPEIVVFLSAINRGDLSPAERVVLAPIVEVERRYLAYFAKQVITAVHWQDLRTSVSDFIELSSRAFGSVAESDPAAAAVMAEKLLALLGMPSRSPISRSVQEGEPSPQLTWIYSAATSTAAVTVLRSVIDDPKVVAKLPASLRNKIGEVIEEAGKRFPK